MKARKTAITAMLVLVLVAACGDNDPSGGSDSGTGDNTPTTERDGYN